MKRIKIGKAFPPIPRAVRRSATLAEVRNAKVPGEQRIGRLVLIVSYLCTDGDYEGAMRELNREIALHPNDGMLHGLAGNVLSDAGKFEEAVVEYETAIRLNTPDDGGMRLRLGDLQYNAGRRTDARAAWRSAINVAEQKHRSTHQSIWERIFNVFLSPAALARRRLKRYTGE